MKKVFAVILLLALLLAGCANQDFAEPPGTEAFQINSRPTLSTEVTDVTEGLDDKEMEDKLIPNGTEAISGKDNSSETTDPVEKPADSSTSKPDPTKPQDDEDPQQTDPPQETGTTPTTPATTTPVPPTQAETVPTQPESSNPETEPTEPETTPTVPPTEPTGCTHEWKCISHAEEGHWRAGIICDCGWTVYGDPSELNALWNAHSASFPPAESLFEHGGFGSMDEWIVDKPAYDEWVCRHCGNQKE
ncbi:MAG: hypothetical protein E7437_02915 [Ruminococcaceae bacterium]|nr:hypothetical protein [Oscillospiraceae bacterium]